jgi:hypothetical protein
MQAKQMIPKTEREVWRAYWHERILQLCQQHEEHERLEQERDRELVALKRRHGLVVVVGGRDE